MKHHPKIVEAFWDSHGIPRPKPEFEFAKTIEYIDKAGRKRTRGWRFDYAWDEIIPRGEGVSMWNPKLALEVQGGCFMQGRHSRGAAMRSEHLKLNTAAGMGWRIIYCFPENLLKTETANLVKVCLGIG